MFIDKSFINELRASLESHMGEEFVAEPYAGSEVAEELLALDDMENMVVASESYAEAIVEGALGYQELALESAGLTLEEFGKFQDSLGTEAIINAVKRGGYNVVIAVKKAVAKLIKLIFAVFDFFVLADGRWKSYSKLFKKYREKMIRLKPGISEKAVDKEYTLRNHSVALALVSALQTVLGSNGVLNSLKTVSSTVSVKAFVGISDSVEGLVNGALALSKSGKTVNVPKGAAADAINKAIDAWQEFVKDGELKEIVKDIKSEYEDAFKETHDKKAADAVSEMISTLSSFENATKKDLKWLKDIKKIQKDIDKAIEKYKPEANNNQELDNAVLRLLGVLADIVNKTKYVISASVKMANSNMQAVLSDAAKVIAGETRISD